MKSVERSVERGALAFGQVAVVLLAVDRRIGQSREHTAGARHAARRGLGDGLPELRALDRACALDPKRVLDTTVTRRRRASAGGVRLRLHGSFADVGVSVFEVLGIGRIGLVVEFHLP